MSVITKKLFKLWLTGYLSGQFPSNETEWGKFIEESEKVKNQVKEIVCFLDEYDCFNKDMKDE